VGDGVDLSSRLVEECLQAARAQATAPAASVDLQNVQSGRRRPLHSSSVPRTPSSFRKAALKIRPIRNGEVGSPQSPAAEAGQKLQHLRHGLARRDAVQAHYLGLAHAVLEVVPIGSGKFRVQFLPREEPQHHMQKPPGMSVSTFPPMETRGPSGSGSLIARMFAPTSTYGMRNRQESSWRYARA
jgi:hypothetical protein